MKFAQVLIILAIVAFGIASADFFGFGKKKEEPKQSCDVLIEEDACESCCKTEGHLHGVILRKSGREAGYRVTYKECECRDYEGQAKIVPANPKYV